MKLCPFRKITTVTDYKWEGADPLPHISTTDFDECVGEKCMAYETYFEKPYWDAQTTTKYSRCLLMAKSNTK